MAYDPNNSYAPPLMGPYARTAPFQLDPQLMQAAAAAFRPPQPMGMSAPPQPQDPGFGVKDGVDALSSGLAGFKHNPDAPSSVGGSPGISATAADAGAMPGAGASGVAGSSATGWPALWSFLTGGGNG